MLEELQGIKTELTGAMTQVGELAGAAGNETLRRSLLEDRLPRLEEERFNLVVLGEFNHGKTTFVNALLGKPVLPIGVTPTTAAIHHIVWSEAPWAAAVHTNGEREEVPIESLKRFAVEGDGAQAVRYLEVGYPTELLRHRVVLAPGAEVEGLTTHAVLEQVLSQVPAPR